MDESKLHAQRTTRRQRWGRDGVVVGLRRCAARVAPLVALALLAGGLWEGDALAVSARGHGFAFAFASKGAGKGELEEPTAVAVGDAVDDVYVVDRAGKRVEAFGASGEYRFQLTGTTLGRPQSVAVDNSRPESAGEDPSAGDVYVSTRHGVDKFTAAGKFIRKLTTKEEGASFGEPLAVAVDAHGEVWVQWSEGEIDSFTNAEPNIRTSGEAIESEVGPLRGVFAVDGEDDLYVGYEPEEVYEGEPRERPCELAPCIVAKLSGLGEPASGVSAGAVLQEEVDGENTSAVSADSSNGDVYLDNLTSIAAFTASGKLIQRFGEEQLQGSASGGVAVDADTDTVYVADTSGGHIDVYKPEEPGPPTVEEVSVQEVFAQAAQLNAVIDPRGDSASYVFEYGPAPCSQGACTSVPGGTVGGNGFGEAGFGEATVSARIGTGTAFALQPATTYRYRLKATDAAGSAVSSEGSFSTLPATGQGLADGRVWEMVSLLGNAGAAVEPLAELGGVAQAAANGQAVTYLTDGPFGDPEGSRSLEPTQALSCSSREPSCAAAMGGTTGWFAEDITTANERGTGIELEGPEYRLFSSDLSLSLVDPFPKGGGPLAEPPLSPPLSEAERGRQEKTIYLRDDFPVAPEQAEAPTYERAQSNGVIERNAGFLALVSATNTLPGAQFGQRLFAEGATPDLAHVVLASQVALNGESRAAPEPEDLYEWSASGELQLVNVLPGEAQQLASDAKLGDGGENVRGAISSDGSRVFWSGVQSSEADGVKESVGHLYVRDMLTATTVQVDQLQGGEGEGPNHEYPDDPVFQAASADGSRVFFTDEERLTPHAGSAHHAPDLYEFDLENGMLTDLTVPYRNGENAGVQGLVLGVSETGTSVYFVANGVLSAQAAEPGHATPGNCTGEPGAPAGSSCNLYVEQYEDSAWQPPRFIAALSSEDSPDWLPAGTPGDLGDLTSRVSPNGRFLAFMSDRPLTAYDNRASAPEAHGARAEEVFLYGAEGGRLICASCDPSGARPTGVYDPPSGQESGPEGLGLLVDRPKIWGGRWLAGSVPGWTKVQHIRALYQSRYLSNSGRLFFQSPEPLVPEALNGKEDVYEYEPLGVPQGPHQCTEQNATFSQRVHGCVGLISSGSSTRESAFLDASETGGEGSHGEQLSEGGGDVFFITTEKLVPADTDSSFDLYDAHECTSASPCVIPEQGAQPETCKSTEACRPAKRAPADSPPPPSTALLLPSGNITPAKSQTKSLTQTAKPKPLTRAQQLARALKSCHRLKNPTGRRRCEAQARKRYAPARKTAQQARRANSHAHRNAGRR